MDNWVLKRATLTPHKLAVSDGTVSYTFSEVLAWGQRLGTALVRLGALRAQTKTAKTADARSQNSSKAGSLAGTASPSYSPSCSVAMMADNTIRGYLLAVTLLLHGVTVVWLNKRLTDQELASQMHDAQVKYCLCDDPLLRTNLSQRVYEDASKDSATNRDNNEIAGNTMASGANGDTGEHSTDDSSTVHILTFSEIFAAAQAGEPNTMNNGNQHSARVSENAESCIPRDFPDDHVLSVMFTSGSTGSPKGICQSVRNHFTSATSVALSLGLGNNDEWLCTVPIFHISGYSIILRGLIFGATVRLVHHFDAEAVEQILTSEPITWVSVVPTMLKDLVPVHAQRGSSQRESGYNPKFKGFILGGEKTDLALLERCHELNMPVVRSYGMTETCSQIVGTGLTDGADRLLSVGKPYFTTQLRLAADTSEIQIKTAALTSGYILGNERFEAKKTSDGWYCTGDVGHVDQDGYLYVDGRLDNMMISGGEHVFPEEVERVYSQCPGIAEVAVSAENDAHWGQVPVAYIVPSKVGTDADADATHGTAHLNASDLCAFGRERLAHYKVPQRFYALDALPKTSTGKIRRFLLGADGDTARTAL